MPERDPVSSPKIAQLVSRLEKDPNSKLFLQLAEEYRKAGFHDSAIQVCEEGLRRNPQYHSARVVLAQAYLEVGRLKEARRELEKVRELSPENIKAGKLLASCLASMGEYPRAVTLLKNLARIAPEDAEILSLLKQTEGVPAPAPARPQAPVAAQPPRATPPSAPAAPPRPPARSEPSFGTIMDDTPPDIEEVRRPVLIEEDDQEEMPARRERLIAEIPPEMAMGIDLPDIGLDQEVPQGGPAEERPPDALVVTPSPDLYPSDLQREMQPGQAPAETSMPAEPASAEAVSAPIASATMAEIYAQQGYYAAAIEVYERLRAEGNATPETEARLEELRGMLAFAAPVPEQVPEQVPAPESTMEPPAWTPTPAWPPSPAWAAPSAPQPLVPDAAMRRKVETFRRWLDAIRAEREGR